MNPTSALVYLVSLVSTCLQQLCVELSTIVESVLGTHLRVLPRGSRVPRELCESLRELLVQQSF